MLYVSSCKCVEFPAVHHACRRGQVLGRLTLPPSLLAGAVYDPMLPVWTGIFTGYCELDAQKTSCSWQKPSSRPAGCNLNPGWLPVSHGPSVSCAAHDACMQGPLAAGRASPPTTTPLLSTMLCFISGR